MRTVDKERLVKRLGVLDDKTQVKPPGVVCILSVIN